MASKGCDAAFHSFLSRSFCEQHAELHKPSETNSCRDRAECPCIAIGTMCWMGSLIINVPFRLAFWSPEQPYLMWKPALTAPLKSNCPKQNSTRINRPLYTFSILENNPRICYCSSFNEKNAWEIIVFSLISHRCVICVVRKRTCCVFNKQETDTTVQFNNNNYYNNNDNNKLSSVVKAKSLLIQMLSSPGATSEHTGSVSNFWKTSSNVGSSPRNTRCQYHVHLMFFNF